MANEQNLIPGAHPLTVEEQSRGGKASAEARRRRRTLKEELLLMLSDPEVQEKLSAAIMKKGMDGDIRAFEVIRDTIGEKPKDVFDIRSNEVNIRITEDD